MYQNVSQWYLPVSNGGSVEAGGGRVWRPQLGVESVELAGGGKRRHLLSPARSNVI